MARSSDVLDLAVEGKQKKKSRKKLIVGIAMLGVIPVIGSTFAATITVGSGNIEFGQGTQAVTACDTSISVALASSWDSGTSSFKVSSVTLSDVNTSTKSSGTGCNGEKIVVKLLNSSGSELDSITMTISNTSGSMKPTGVTSSGSTTDTITISTATTDASLGTDGESLDSVAAADVARVTVESS